MSVPCQTFAAILRDQKECQKVCQKACQVGSHKGKYMSAMLWAAEGGENCDKRNVFDKRNVVVESMGCRAGGGKF